ncbi:MAG: hypothetical protein JNL52_13125 [Flavobacteriales bacterium]|nr:hypothetical protein [Flavobacteriales bacterium]
MTSGLPADARAAVWIGALVLAITAFFSLGVHHADEHYQILEFAGWKLGITPASELPWEFGERMRPALQPAIVVAVHRSLALLGEPDPFTVSLIVRLLTAVLSFTAAVLLLKGKLRIDPVMQRGHWLRLYLFLAFFLWFSVYCGVRFSSEGLSGALFSIGFVGVAFSLGPRSRLVLFGSGVVLGLAVVARFQVGLMVAGLLIWAVLVKQLRWDRTAALLLGIFVSLGAGFVLDRWFYGEWVFTIWNYVDLNIIQGKADSFGIEPWWYYFTTLVERALPPFSLFFLIGPMILFVVGRRDALTWAVVPFLLAHLLVSHKELRFIFPIIPLLPALVVGGLSKAEEREWLRWLSDRVARSFRMFFLVVHVPLLLVIMFKPAQDDVGFYRELYRLAHPGDLILHDNDDPFKQGLPVWYIRPRGVRVGSVQSTDLRTEGRLLFVSRSRDQAFPSGMRTELLYSAFPDWLLRMNVGGWADRTAVWRIWEINSYKPASPIGADVPSDHPKP